MRTGRIHRTPSLQYDAADQAVAKLRAYFSPLSGTNDGYTGGHHHLLQLRATAGLGEHISAIRILDVLAWMDGKGYADPPPASAEDHDGNVGSGETE